MQNQTGGCLSWEGHTRLLCDISLHVHYLHVYNPIYFNLYKINSLKIPTTADI